MSETKERRSFTNEQKREIIEYAEKHSTNEAAKKFKMKPPQISGWKKKLSLGVTPKPSSNSPMVGQVSLSSEEYVIFALEVSKSRYADKTKRFDELARRAGDILLGK
jgi:transposase-like protein